MEGKEGKNSEFRAWHCGRQGRDAQELARGAIGGASDRFEAQVIRRRNSLKRLSSNAASEVSESTHPLTHSLTHSLSDPLTHSLTDPLTHCPLTHSPTHPLTDPLTDPLTHSLTD